MNNIETLEEKFKTLTENIVLDHAAMDVTTGEIAKKLNSVYYNQKNDSSSHMYIVGSVGRNTAIKNSSDLDLLFDLPVEIYHKYDNYKYNGQSALLQDVKNALVERYPKTTIRGDGQVVVLEFTNYTVELVPGFIQNDSRFKYPDTHDGGKWKYTDPLSEKEKCANNDIQSNGIFSDFCHIIRAWKNEIGFEFKGLLIDTLVNENFEENDYYSGKGYSSYLEIFKNILEYLKSQNSNQNYWFALGSNQKIYNTDNAEFIKKASDALDMIENSENISITLHDLLGDEFPAEELQEECSSYSYDNTEKYIQNLFPVDIKYNLKIDGVVSQNGFREYNIRNHASMQRAISHNRKIKFFIESTNCPSPYSIYWKVRNVGAVAEKKNLIRGQIIKGNDTHTEPTSFYGPHFVECYLIKNGVCVAKNKLLVPIGYE